MHQCSFKQSLHQCSSSSLITSPRTFASIRNIALNAAPHAGLLPCIADTRTRSSLCKGFRSTPGAYTCTRQCTRDLEVVPKTSGGTEATNSAGSEPDRGRSLSCGLIPRPVQVLLPSHTLSVLTRLIGVGVASYQCLCRPPTLSPPLTLVLFKSSWRVQSRKCFCSSFSQLRPPPLQPPAAATTTNTSSLPQNEPPHVVLQPKLQPVQTSHQSDAPKAGAFDAHNHHQPSQYSSTPAARLNAPPHSDLSVYDLARTAGMYEVVELEFGGGEVVRMMRGALSLGGPYSSLHRCAQDIAHGCRVLPIFCGALTG